MYAVLIYDPITRLWLEAETDIANKEHASASARLLKEQFTKGIRVKVVEE